MTLTDSDTNIGQNRNVALISALSTSTTARANLPCRISEVHVLELNSACDSVRSLAKRRVCIDFRHLQVETLANFAERLNTNSIDRIVDGSGRDSCIEKNHQMRRNETKEIGSQKHGHDNDEYVSRLVDDVDLQQICTVSRKGAYFAIHHSSYRRPHPRKANRTK